MKLRAISKFYFFRGAFVVLRSRFPNGIPTPLQGPQKRHRDYAPSSFKVKISASDNMAAKRTAKKGDWKTINMPEKN